MFESVDEKIWEHRCSNKSIYECDNEWIEKGNKITHGLISYYETYFDERQEKISLSTLSRMSKLFTPGEKAYAD